MDTDADIAQATELARQLQSGQTEVFPALMQFYRLKVYATAFQVTRSHLDAQDIVQETFITVLEKIAQWQGNNFDGWLLQIARHRAIDYLRKRRVPQEQYAEGAVLPVDELSRQDTQEFVHRILQSLPKQQREILYLRHFQGCTIQEIAHKLQRAPGTIKATLFQVMQKLRQEFKNADLL